MGAAVSHCSVDFYRLLTTSRQTNQMITSVITAEDKSLYNKGLTKDLTAKSKKPTSLRKNQHLSRDLKEEDG